MIKKILTVLAVFIFAFAVLSLSVLKVSALTPLIKKPNSVRVVVTPTPTPKPEINYYLPYPGVLPDQPLYSLKMIRDRIWLWLASGPINKAKLMVLYGDKRLGAGRVLIEGNKVNLGLTTLEKGEKYLESALNQLEEAKKSGKDVKKEAENLSLAMQKHEEVLLKLKEKLTGEEAMALEKILTYPKNLYQRVQTLLTE